MSDADCHTIYKKSSKNSRACIRKKLDKTRMGLGLIRMLSALIANHMIDPVQLKKRVNETEALLFEGEDLAIKEPKPIPRSSEQDNEHKSAYPTRVIRILLANSIAINVWYRNIRILGRDTGRKETENHKPKHMPLT